MTGAHSKQDSTAAAAWFTGIMTLAAGGAGLVLAGLVLGLDYLLHGDPGEREALTERRARNWQRRYQDAVDWLEADRRDRERHRQAVRDWFGGDPATRGEKPSSGETFGRFFGRAWNWLNVGGTRFWRGWKTGWTKAKQRRADGDANWWKSDWNRKPEPEAAPTEPATGPEPERQNQPGGANGGDGRKPEGDVVDAEIVTEAPPVDRTVVPVGADAPVMDDRTTSGYATELDHLQRQVEDSRRRNGRDPSPPRSALPEMR